MNTKNNYLDRRRHPRINEQIQFKFNTEYFDVVTETMNLSCIGAYCQVNKKIPLMTNLKIFLALPYSDKETEFEYVECNGVVVRVEEAVSEANISCTYNIAIYFNEIEESDKEKIGNFFKVHGHKEIEKVH